MLQECAQSQHDTKQGCKFFPRLCGDEAVVVVFVLRFEMLLVCWCCSLMLQNKTQYSGCSCGSRSCNCCFCYWGSKCCWCCYNWCNNNNMLSLDVAKCCCLLSWNNSLQKKVSLKRILYIEWKYSASTTFTEGKIKWIFLLPFLFERICKEVNAVLNQLVS